MKAIIFDMDGTMVDNMMIHHKAWQETLLELGLDWDLEKIRQEVHGVNVEILKRLFGSRFNSEERETISFEKEERYRQIYKPDLKLIKGLTTFLDQLSKKGIPLAVGSAAPPGNVDFVLDNLKLRDKFLYVLHSDSVSQGKPHPEIYLKLSALLGYEPKDIVVFEDSPTGAKAASEAGCPCVVITTTHTAHEFEGISGIVRFIEDYSGFEIEDIQ